MLEIIKKILDIAVHAPSGENLQPWKFAIKDSVLDVFNIPERDQSPYNTNQFASFVAIGTLIENIAIASTHFKLRATIQLFPDSNLDDLVARVIFSSNSGSVDNLFEFIPKRATNRKKYDGKLLNTEIKDDLTNAAPEVSTGKIKFVDNRSDLKLLSKALSLNEQLVFEVRELHDFFFSHMRWNEDDESEYKNGLYLKTLELKPFQIAAFHFFKHWFILNAFNKLGFSKVVAKDNENTYLTSSAIGAIFVRDQSAKGWVNAGRILQRVWLKAVQLGLSIQPSTGVTFFKPRIDCGEAKEFTERQIFKILKAYDTIMKVFGLTGQFIIVPFRIGYGGEPSARSSRHKPDITILK